MTTRYSRLEQTATFRGGGMGAWQRATCGIIGCGVIGSRLAVELVRSGAGVWLCDFDKASEHNTGTQAVEPGRLKVHSVIEACNAVRCGAARGRSCDIRHVGVGVLRQCDVLIDCTDDARLAFGLTETSNGLGVPLIRVAVDGSGQWEFGRVLCSDPRGGGACQMCGHSFEDLFRTPLPTPCPGASMADRPPTLAGGAIASAITGVATLQIQRLLTGNDVEQVRNREVIVDLTNMTLMNARLPRSEQCISGHQTWNLVEVPSTRLQTLGDLFGEASTQLGTHHIAIEPHNHPLCIEAACNCGATTLRAGTVWSTPPRCSRCDSTMSWRTETQQPAFNHEFISRLQIQDRPLDELGFAARGAMFTARAESQPALRILLV